MTTSSQSLAGGDLSEADEIAHQLRTLGKNICWVPTVELDQRAQQKIHELTEKASALILSQQAQAAHHSAQLEKALGRIAELEAGLGQIAKLYSEWVPPDDAERFLNNQVARASDIARALLHPDSTKS